MQEQLRDKIRKIYELVQRGATDGERAAAKAALDRLMKNYNLSDEVLNGIEKKKYYFTFKTNKDKSLLIRIVAFMIEDMPTLTYDFKDGAKRVNSVSAMLLYEDWVMISCAYEYYRRHMAAQWKKVVEPIIKKHKKHSIRKARFKELEQPFISRYIINSGLFKPEELVSEELQGKDRKNALAMWGVEGGTYNKQVNSGLYLS